MYILVFGQTMELLIRLEGMIAVYFLLCVGSTWSQLTMDYNWSEKECPDENTPMMVTNVPWGVEGRAYKTLPRGLLIAPSKIPGAGFGVLSETFIPRFTWLGEYEGEIVSMKDCEQASWYTWQLHRSGHYTVCIDAFHLHLSSYHRYINAPMRHRDQNVIALECYDRMYYMTNKDILPGDELLVYYGHEYAEEFGINFNLYFEVSKEFLDGGLDLNNASHRFSVERAGLSLEQLKYFSPSWLSVFI